MSSTGCSVPIIVCEEHHEAFIVWNDAIRRGWIPTEKNTLIHVDTHEDMALPVLSRSVNTLKTDPKDIRDFTYNELNIASFIIPALYLKIFNTFYWLNPISDKKDTTVRKKYVRTYREEGRIFITGNDPSPWPHNKNWQDRVTFRCYAGSIRDVPVAEGSTVLDIDLDFFDCSRIINHYEKIEVTKEQYRAVRNNTYSSLRLRWNAHPEREGERYYLCLNRDIKELEPASKSSEKDIRARLHRFKDFLLKNHVKPVLISISRSRYSGYTPAEHLGFIESSLLTMLKEIYPGAYSTDEQSRQRLAPGAVQCGKTDV